MSRYPKTQSPLLERKAYSIAEVMEMLGFSRQHIYNLADRGELRLVRLGKRVLIPATEIDRILQPKGPA